MTPPVTETSDSPTARPEWFRGSGEAGWGLAQEVAWLASIARPEVLTTYLRTLSRRFWGFGWPKVPMTAVERDQLRAAAEARLEALGGDR